MLKFVLLKGFERRGPGAQSIVLGHPVKNVNAAVVQQGGLGDRPFRGGAANLAMF
jgi:hypothetical protein